MYYCKKFHMLCNFSFPVSLDEGNNAMDSGYLLVVRPDVQDPLIFKEWFLNVT